MEHRETGFEKIGLPVVLAELKRFQKFVDSSKELVFLHGGTLLGAVRDTKLILKDKDLDFGVLDEDALYRLEKILKPHFTQVAVEGPKGGKTLWVLQHIGDKYILPFEVQCFYKHKGVWVYNRALGRSWGYPEGKCTWPEAQLAQMHSMEFDGITFQIPSPPEGFLTSFYGEDWKTPKTYSDWRYNCKNLSEGFAGGEPVIMIAGASRGIGLAMAQDLKKRAKVSACARTMRPEESENFIAMDCDLTKDEDIKRWVAGTVKKFGCIDILIFNAGVLELSRLMEAKRESADRMYRLSVLAYLSTLQLVVPEMLRRKSGYVINVSSTRGVSGAPEKGLYSAVKMAAVALTETLGEEWKAISTTSVHFGMIHTLSSVKIYGQSIAEFFPITEDDVVKTIIWLTTLTPKARPKSLVIGGKL